jgi:N-acetylneuraminic acid mutarotase
MQKKITVLLLIMFSFFLSANGQTWLIDSLPNVPFYQDMFTLNGKIYVIGLASNTANPAFHIYNETTKKWTVENIPFKMTSRALVPIGSKMYCLQGYDVNGNPAKNLEIYNALMSTWKRDSMPFVPNGAGVGSIGSKLFVAGGQELLQGTAISLVRIYDTLTQRWTTSTPLSAARSQPEVIKVKNKLLFIGGSKSGTGTGLDWTFFKNIDIYDETTGTWSTVFMKTGRLYPSVTVSGSKVLIAGGVYKAEYVGAAPTLFHTKTAEIFDVDTNTWQTADMPKPRLFTGVAYDKKSYFICGSVMDETTGTGIVYNKVDVYNFATNTWTELPFPNVNQVRGGAYQLGLGNKIYFMGGYLADYSNSKRIDILTLPPSSIFEPTVLDNKLSIFPSPAVRELTIDFDKKEEKTYNLKVTNVLGQVVLNQSNISTNSSTIDITAFDRGVYFLTVYTSKGVKSQSFVKQ